MKHGGGRRGSARAPEYVAWQNMKRRCYDTNTVDYPNYGGRGISVCPEWRNDYSKFLEDVGPRPSPKHTLDRVDNSGPYSAANCRWATRLEQKHNQRVRKDTVFVGGKTLKQIALDTNTPYETIWWRYHHGKLER